MIGDWYCSGVYTEAILQDVLEYRGLEDLEIELDLLLDKNQDMFLEQVLRVLKTKGAGERSATYQLLPNVADSVTGCAYKHQTEDAMKGLSQKVRDPYSYFGK